jgi:hypothetical protein
MGGKNTETKAQEATKTVSRVTETSAKEDKPLSASEKKARMEAYSNSVKDRKDDDHNISASSKVDISKQIEEMRSGMAGKNDESRPRSAPVKQQSGGFER